MGERSCRLQDRETFVPCTGVPLGAYHQELGKSEWTAVMDFMGVVMDLWLDSV